MVLPVLLIFSVIGFFSIFENEADNYDNRIISAFFGLLLVALIIIATFRPEVMRDYSNYIYVFQTGNSERMEPGFMGIIYFFQLFTYDKYVFLAFFAALSISLKLKAIKILSPFILTSIIIYLSNIFILHDLIQMRCAIASGLLLFAVKYIYERDRNKFLIILIIAMMFHYSSIAMLPLWFINTQKPQKIFYLSIIPISYFLAITGNLIGQYVQYIPIEQVQELWNAYDKAMLLGEGTEINIFNLIQLGRCAICIFILYNIDIISQFNRMSILLVKIYTISLSALPIFSDIPVIAFRINEFYLVIEFILIPMIIYTFKQVMVGKIIVLLVAAAFLFLNVFSTRLLL